jgi:hypothetical protein
LDAEAAAPVDAPKSDTPEPVAEQAQPDASAAEPEQDPIAASAEPAVETATDSAAEAPEGAVDAVVSDASAEVKSDTPVTETTQTEDAVVTSDAAPEVGPEEVAPEAGPKPVPAPAAPQKSGGFVPMLLGGAIAAGLGYGAHFLQTDERSNPALDALQTEIADLRTSVSQGPDLSELEAQIAALEPASAPDLSAVNASLDDLRAQIAALPELGGLQAQLDELRAAAGVDLGPIEQQLAALESAYAPLPDQIAALEADMAELRALATEEIAQAEAAVNVALGQAGLDRIAAALVTGDSFAEAVAQLGDAGITVPEPIAVSAAEGVRTLEELQESYGEAARAAIGASLQTAPADSATEKLGNFFRAQIGARSLAPREGDGPDAVTSRAGAAVEAGDLQSALTELAALPEDGRAAMSDWLSAAQTRLDVAAELDALQADMTTR